MGRKKKPEPPTETPSNAPAGPLRHAPLAGLKTLRDAMPAPEEPAAKKKDERAVKAAEKTKGATHDVWRPDLDKELFDVAMSGVVPLRSRGRGVERVSGGPSGQGAKMDVSMRRAAAEGDERIAVRWDESGQCVAMRKSGAFALEALERFAIPEDSLDLHGLDVTEACARVAEFVRTRSARGMRVVRIVHGIGRHAPDGTPRLRDAAVDTLSQPPTSRHVEAFRTAAPAHGGSGALVVALRRR